jgi:hypothetical protein
MGKLLIFVCAGVMCLIASGCRPAPVKDEVPAIVGTWIVSIPDAPFPIHMFVFHSDGTVVQSNPEAGDPNTSDSNLMGVWVRAGDAFQGRLVEITADRATHGFVSRGDITYRLTVSGNALHGNATAVFHDADWHQIGIPIQTTLTGERVLP